MGPMTVVLDTNIALDLLVFDDAACAPLAAALARGELRWLATGPMRGEFARVLGYAPVAARLARRALGAAAVLAAFDALAVPAPVADPAPCRCSDPDDQMFIDLAVAHGALLLSKDLAVLSLAGRLAGLGVPVRVALNSTAKEQRAAGCPAR